MSDTLFSMASALSAENGADKPLPVETWHPDHCGAMDLTIRRDGTWVHQGTPIGRPALVRLFSRVLRKDTDGYVLVTPAEKLSINVEDVPFLVVDLDVTGVGNDQSLSVRTNVGDVVAIGADHPLSVRQTPDGADVPYVRIRGGLAARFGRAAYYALVDLAEATPNGRLHVTSGGVSFDLGSVT